VTPTIGMVPIVANILDPFWNLWSFRKWDKGMDINPEEETSYTTQYQEAILKYVQNTYCAKHRRVAVNRLKAHWAAISCPLQHRQDPLNDPLICMICAAMMKMT
jgi:hypothetical protein